MRFVIVAFVSGLLLGALDALLQGNPLARESLSLFIPLARDQVNVLAGLGLDLFYGFALAGIFVLLHPSLPGKTGTVKGISFAVLAWFLKIFMNQAAQWLVFPLTASAVAYELAAGLVEMLAVGILYAWTLVPGSGRGYTPLARTQ